MIFRLLPKLKITGTISLLGLIVLLAVYGDRWGFFRNQPDNNIIQVPVMNLSSPGCIYQGTLKRNEPLFLSLQSNGVPYKLIAELTPAFKGKFDMRKCLPGDFYTLVTSPDSVLSFEYQKGMQEKCFVTRDNGELHAWVKPLEFNCLVKSLCGEIKSSLWESMIELCETPELIMKYAEVLEWEIDFLTEPRNGDNFRLLFEEYHKDGKFIRYGDVLVAEYKSTDKIHQSVLYISPEGKKGYYEPSGSSSRKAFLKSPLNYRRISSRFSHGRFNTIFKRYQPHLGVDYAAPTGTPVVSSGDGTVTFAGWKRGFGKIVEIRHPNGFITSYGHLSRFAKGIRSGTKVSQKQLVGYVGSTGASSGPHLDYRVKANGRYVNPLRMVAPPVEPIKEQYMVDFQKKRDSLLFALEILASQDLLAMSQDH
jgi:hypothetical protein